MHSEQSGLTGSTSRREIAEESLIELARELIRIPSQGGIDPPDRILFFIRRWLDDHGVAVTELRSGSAPVGLVATIEGAKPGPRVCLDACVDTASVGNPLTWNVDPFGGEVLGGWLCGRGAADSKIAVAMFLHLAEALVREPPSRGEVVFLFDADEHTGSFGGARAFMEGHSPPTMAMIGYPGCDRVMIGARGFYRAEVVIYGEGAHSGSSRNRGSNAVVKASRLATLVDQLVLPSDSDPLFPMGPRVTVTEIDGGNGFSSVPDECTVSIDVRLTSTFTAEDARQAIQTCVDQVDRDIPTGSPSLLKERETWPAYALPPDSPLVQALRSAASREFGHLVGTAVAGPSNIGNYLAGLGVPATCGFGVCYRGLHAIDEAVEVSTIVPAYRTYAVALEILLSQDPP